MLGSNAIRNWYLVHKWTSLICTIFLLLLCITGLPLIFYHEIDHLTGREAEPPALQGVPPASPDRFIAAGLERFPRQAVQYLSFDEHEPLVYLTMAPKVDSPPDDAHFLTLDARTAEIFDVPPFDEGFMYILFKLHTDLFVGLPGLLFMGLMGLLFVASIVSGVVVYGPFMRRLDFGTVRKDKSTRIKWLDLHNLLGVVTLAWAFVVGLTGVINTLATPIIQLWQADQLAQIVAPYRGKPIPTQLGPVSKAIDTANAAAPNMTPAFVAFPGTPFSSTHHYGVFMRGDTALTSKLLMPAIVDSVTGELTAMKPLPWYAAALLVSQPLHFGDYGEMPMKIIWAVLDIVTIIVLGSGVYLWVGRRRAPLASRVAELEMGAQKAGATP
jgi:uncharacterized iron-regulated membrane protein